MAGHQEGCTIRFLQNGMGIIMDAAEEIPAFMKEKKCYMERAE